MITFPVKYDALRKAICNEIQRISGIPAIMSEPETQQTPRPSLPYFTLKFMGPAGKQGDDSVNRSMTSPVVNIGGQRRLDASFQCFGRSHEESYNYMTLWEQCMETETTQANLRTAGIAVWLNGSVRDISALLQTGFEGRSQMDVQLGITSNISEDQGEIDTVTVTGTVTSDQDVANPVTVTVTDK